FISIFIFANAQSKITISDSRIGLLKTTSNKVLGYAFVAMNKNVVFTAAHNIIYDEHMLFEDAQGRQFSLRVVATDKVGDIGVLMTNDNIHDDPYNLNLNFSIDQETELFGFGSNDSSDSQMKFRASLSGKASKIQKNREYKSVNLNMKNAPVMSGMPVLNAYNEVIGLVTSSNNNDAIIKVSIMDGDMWKKM
ncbi:MAG: hypothetical protein V3V00_12230, partial [Saprospiraceae bacterium]